MTARQKRMKRARSKAWSPEARAKRRATWAAKRAAQGVPNRSSEPRGGRPVGARGRGRYRGSGPGSVTDAVALLEMSEAAIFRRTGQGRRGQRLQVSETYAMLALATLRGEV